MSKTLKITPLRTSIFRAHQNLNKFVCENLVRTPLQEGSILAVTSKIVSLSEGKLIKQEGTDKDQLVISEADYDLGEVAYGCRLTIKDGLFIPSAGIDESNSEDGSFILYPDNAFASAEGLHAHLKQTYQLKSFGVLITDSHTLPLRQGVTGIALAYWGFEGVKNMIGQKDLFGRKLMMTKMDIADGLASAAVMMMGEADEASPLALIENPPVTFCEKTNPNEIQIPPELDLYYPLYRDRI